MSLNKFYQRILKQPGKAASHFAEPQQAAGLPKEHINQFADSIRGWEPSNDAQHLLKERALDNLENRLTLIESSEATIAANNGSNADETATEPVIQLNSADAAVVAEAAEIITEAVEIAAENVGTITAEQVAQWEQAAQSAGVNVEDTLPEAGLRAKIRHEIVSRTFSETGNALGTEEAAAVDAFVESIMGLVREFQQMPRAASARTVVKGTRICKQCGVSEAETLKKNPRYSFCKGVCVYCYNKNRNKKNNKVDTPPVQPTTTATSPAPAENAAVAAS